MEKQKKTQRAQEEDALFVKMIYWVIGAAVLELLLLLLNRYYINDAIASTALFVTVQGAVVALCGIFPVCFVAALYWLVRRKQGEKDLTLPVSAVILTVALTICVVVVFTLGSAGLKLMYMVVPGVAVLALVYYLYQREFFVMATLSAIALLAVRLTSQIAIRPLVTYGYLVFLVVAFVAAILLAVLNAKGKGVTVGEKKFQLFQMQEINYLLLGVTCVLAVGVVVAALLTTLYAVYYGVLVAWLLILAVFYTIKLM